MMISYFKLVKNEVAKELTTTFSYKFQWLGELLSVSIYYFYLSYLSVKTNFSLDGYSIWFYSVVLIGDLGGKLANEMKIGVFEQNYLSVYSLKILFLIKLAASLIRAIVILLVLQTFFFFSTFTLISYKVYLMMIFLLPALAGIAFSLAGLTLLFKEIGWLANILNNSLLFLSGIFISIELLPNWIYRFSFLFPTRLAELLLTCSSFSHFPFQIFILQCIFYPIFGTLVLFFSERHAKKTGAIASY